MNIPKFTFKLPEPLTMSFAKFKEILGKNRN